MMDKSWKDMTPAERMQVAMEAMQNPCAEDEHDYEDMVGTVGEGTMLSQLCKKCFNTQGWIYGLDIRD